MRPYRTFLLLAVSVLTVQYHAQAQSVPTEKPRRVFSVPARPTINDEEDFHRKGNPSTGNITIVSTPVYSTSTAGNASTQYIRKNIILPDSNFYSASLNFVADGKTFKGKELIFSCDRPCRVVYRYTQGLHNGANAAMLGTIVSYNGLASIGKDYRHPTDQYFYSGANLAAFFYTTEKNTEFPRVTINIVGDEAPASLNPKAEKRWLSISNSIGWSAWGVNTDGTSLSYQTTWNNRIIANLNAAGMNIELDNKGYGSSDTRHMVNSLDDNHYAPNPDFISVQHGSNDANNQTVPIADYKANLKKAIAWRNRQVKKAPIWFIAPPPTDRTGYAANYALYVTATQEVVTELLAAGEPDVYFYDPGASDNGVNQIVLNSDPTQDINFTNSNVQVVGTGNERLANMRLHLWGGPNGGHEKIANGFLAKFKATILQKYY